MNKVIDKIENAEKLIRQGKGTTASSIISAINPSSIPRVLRVRFAELCRRNGKPMTGLKTIAPIIKERRLLSDKATRVEFCEYAACLSAVGVTKEAEKILLGLIDKSMPAAYLYLSFLYFSRWEYLNAIPLLEQYINLDLPAYQNWVGRVNLAAAQVFSKKFDLAESNLNRLEDLLTNQNANLLLGNVYELRAQLETARGNYTAAENCINKSQKFLRESQSDTVFYMRKWRAVINLKKNGPKNGNIQEILSCRKLAANRKMYEIVRDCDLHLAEHQKSIELFQHVYFGTPYQSYRDNINKVLPHELPKEYLWSNHSEPGGKIIDALRGETDNLVNSFKPSQSLHRCFMVLSSDFYRPLTVGQLFTKVFPEEQFNPLSSPGRVYQVVRNLRIWFAHNKINIELQKSNEGYMLRPLESVSIRVHLAPSPESIFDVLWLRLQNRNLTGTFRADTACKTLGISRSTFNEFAKWAEFNGKLRRLGKSSATKYENLAA